MGAAPEVVRSPSREVCKQSQEDPTESKRSLPDSGSRTLWLGSFRPVSSVHPFSLSAHPGLAWATGGTDAGSPESGQRAACWGRRGSGTCGCPASSQTRGLCTRSPLRERHPGSQAWSGSGRGSDHRQSKSHRWAQTPRQTGAVRG